jgi:hypothetical protein
MADVYQDVWKDEGGEVHTIGVSLDKGWMHVRGAGDEMIVWRNHNDDYAYMAAPSQLSIRLGDLKVKGNYAVALGPWGDGSPGLYAYVQHVDAETAGLRIYDMAGGLVGQYLDAPYAAEGIAHVTSDGRVIMHNDPSRFRVVPNGEFWHNIEETENHILGQFGRDPDFGGSISCYDKRTGVTRRWLGYTPLPFKAVEDKHGNLHVAISGNNPPAPDAVEWVANFPPLPGTEPKPDPPPVDPPKPADCTAELERIGELTIELARTRIERDERISKLQAHLDAALLKVPTEPVYTAAQLVKLVNDATGKMAGYWRYLGVQGAVDRAVKAELARRK